MSERNSVPFGILPGVERTTNFGLPCIRVQTAQASGLVFLQGAQVAEFAPNGQSAVLWLSEKAIYQPGKPIRGGIPICFPWFGAHPEQAHFPQHGFARTHAFEYLGARLAKTGGAELEFVLLDDAGTRALFAHEFQARLTVAFEQTLTLEFSVTNRGAHAFSFEEALHSYFQVADVRRASVAGLGGASYTDKVQGGAVFMQSEQELELSAETDRVYASSSTCTIVDPDSERLISIEKANSKNTVVWNPWSEKAAQMADFAADAWPNMLCVESANVAGNRISLAPGETHSMRMVIRAAASSASTSQP
jgi:glucose-6-phosphate 1-epimerase